MKQAKVLTVAERKRLLVVIANDRHSERNRLAVMLSFLAGLRVGEIAALKVSDVVDGARRSYTTPRDTLPPSDFPWEHRRAAPARYS